MNCLKKRPFSRMQKTVTYLLCLFVSSAWSLQQDTIDVTVSSTRLQKFGGFGMHQGGLKSGPNFKFAEEYADTIASLIIKDLKITHGRIYPAIWFADSIADSCILKWDERYQWSDTGKHVFDYWKKYNPNMFWICSYSGSQISGKVVKSIDVMKPHCDAIASVVKALAERRDMHFSWLGIINEPNDTKEGVLDTAKAADGSDSIYTRRRVPFDWYPTLVKTMRQSLDEHGLDTMKIMGPEVSSVDDACYEYLLAVERDSAAMAAFGVLFSKAYNMCASPGMRDFAMRHKIPYLAAAGANIREGGQADGKQWPYENSSDNTHFAADHVCRIINDFNHGCSHWAAYLNFDDFYYRECSHRLAWVWRTRESAMEWISDTNSILEFGPNCYAVISLKYFYQKHLAHTLDAGGVFRQCSVADGLPDGMTKDMWYTFGQKPSINATAIRNPDSTWTVAVVNMSGGIDDTVQPPQFWYFDSTSYTVNVKIDELANSGALKFGVVRSNRTLRLEAQDSVTAQNGVLSFQIEPLELVTLRSAASTVDAGRMNRYAKYCAHNWYTLTPGAIHIALPETGNYQVELYATDGSRICRHAAGQQTNSIRIPLDNISAGIYCLTIGGSEGFVKAERILVR
jgi:hypothetical protein